MDTPIEIPNGNLYCSAEDMERIIHIENNLPISENSISEENILTEDKKKEIIYLLSSMLNTINNMANDINNYGEDECNYCKHLPCGGDGNCGYFNNDNPKGFYSCNFEWRFAKEVQNIIEQLKQ